MEHIKIVCRAHGNSVVDADGDSPNLEQIDAEHWTVAFEDTVHCVDAPANEECLWEVSIS